MTKQRVIKGHKGFEYYCERCPWDGYRWVYYYRVKGHKVFVGASVRNKAGLIDRLNSDGAELSYYRSIFQSADVKLKEHALEQAENQLERELAHSPRDSMDTHSNPGRLVRKMKIEMDRIPNAEKRVKSARADLSRARYLRSELGDDYFDELKSKYNLRWVDEY